MEGVVLILMTVCVVSAYGQGPNNQYRPDGNANRREPSLSGEPPVREKQTPVANDPFIFPRQLSPDEIASRRRALESLLSSLNRDPVVREKETPTVDNHPLPPVAPSIKLPPLSDTHQPLNGYGGHTCEQEFFFSYDHGLYGRVWQGVRGHVAFENGTAVFDGQGSLIIPYFACNDLMPRYSMQFTICPNTDAYQDMAVLGNSLFPETATFQVSLSGSSLKLVIRPRTAKEDPISLVKKCAYQGTKNQPSQVDKQPVILSVPIQQFSCSNVTIIHEDGKIFLGADDDVAYGEGELPLLTREPLYVGSGIDIVSGQLSNLYKGTFDSFSFEKCPARLLSPQKHH